MIHTLYRMTVRNVKIYLKDRMSVFFSLIAPLIVMGLYILFLGRIQVDAVNSVLEQAGVSLDASAVKAFCDAWMLTGMMATACITVALCSAAVIIQDKRRGIVADTAASPVPKWIPTAAYFVSTFLATVAICLIALCVAFIYLAAAQLWYLSFLDVLGLIGTVLLSALSSTMVVILIASFVKTESAFSGVNIIMGTTIGFLIGAYMPITMFPKAVQYFTLFIPGSYSAGLFRHFFLGGVLADMGTVLPAQLVESLSAAYSVKLDFFGLTMNAGVMAAVLAGTVLLFAGINILVLYLKNKKTKN